MPGALVDAGTGTVVTFVTSAFTFQLLSLSHSGINRESIDTSHMGTAAPAAGKFGNRTFIPGDLSDPGEVTMEGHFNPDTIPPIDAASETIRIEFPLSAGGLTKAKYEFSGFMTSFEYEDPLEDKMTATFTVKATGNVTRTAAT